MNIENQQQCKEIHFISLSKGELASTRGFLFQLTLMLLVQQLMLSLKHGLRTRVIQ